MTKKILLKSTDFGYQDLCNLFLRDDSMNSFETKLDNIIKLLCSIDKAIHIYNTKNLFMEKKSEEIRLKCIRTYKNLVLRLSMLSLKYPDFDNPIKESFKAKYSNVLHNSILYDSMIFLPDSIIRIDRDNSVSLNIIYDSIIDRLNTFNSEMAELINEIDNHLKN